MTRLRSLRLDRRHMRAMVVAMSVWSGGHLAQAVEPAEWKLPAAEKPPVSQATSLDHLIASLRVPLPKPSGPPAALPLDQLGIRGPEAIEVYRKAAPAVVYVTDGETGHGSGAFISSDGWVMTNNHVVEGMPYSLKHGAQVARIVYGSLGTEGSMEVAEGYLEGIVFRRDEQRDLALLKVVKLPGRRSSVPYLALAAEPPVNGENCFAIGHPSSGVLWTLRVGIISGHGRFPHDNINVMLKGADADITRQFTESLRGVPSRVVTLSSCGINPGDSGGPLLNEAAELIAVTFAIPAEVRDKSFAYHIHLDEVKAFLKDRPTEPIVVPPSSDFQAAYVSIEDLDDDGSPDARAFRDEEDDRAVALQVDLDQNSANERKAGPREQAAAQADDGRGDWDYELAILAYPVPTLFLDTDNDGAVDLIHRVQSGNQPAVRLSRRAGLWTISECSDFVPPAPFNDRGLNLRYRQVARGLGMLEDDDSKTSKER